MSCKDRESEGKPGNGVDRRDFLRVLGASAWLGALPDFPLPAAKLDRIGIQLYTVRREFAADPDATLARLARIGFKEVEFAGYPDGTAESLRAMLGRHGLTAPSSHVGLSALRSDWDKALDQAAAIGQRYIVVPSVPQSQRQTLDDWKRLAAIFNKAAERAKAKGMQFAYHNHDFEFVPIEQRAPYDLLLAETDAQLVALELDLYWMTKAGHDPVSWFARWPGRFPLVHVKDMDATPRRSFVPAGKGTIDFARIFKQAKHAGIKHFFYEQDDTEGSPFDAARVSFEYMRALTF
jgi:sugar phosphate isomerase/epimerase